MSAPAANPRVHRLRFPQERATIFNMPFHVGGMRNVGSCHLREKAAILAIEVFDAAVLRISSGSGSLKPRTHWDRVST